MLTKLANEMVNLKGLFSCNVQPFKKVFFAVRMTAVQNHHLRGTFLMIYFLSSFYIRFELNRPTAHKASDKLEILMGSAAFSFVHLA